VQREHFGADIPGVYASLSDDAMEDK